MDEIKKIAKQEKIKISNRQLFSLAALGSIGGTVIIISGLVASIAKQDAWITAIITPVMGVFVIWIYCFLGKTYPDMTIIGMAKQIFGKCLGLIVSAGYVIFFLQVSSNVTWHIGDFIGYILHETPVYVINGLFIGVVVIAILYGVEAFARASELFIAFVCIIYIAAFLLMPNLNIQNLQPVLENGIVPLFKASVFLLPFSTFPLITLMMIFPINLVDLKQAGKSFRKGYFWASFLVFIVIILCLLVLGSNITARSQYPTYLEAKQIDVAGIFARLEFLVATIWILTQFAINLLFFYAGTKSLAEFFDLKDYRKIVMPLGLITLVLSGMSFPDTIYQSNWNSIVWTPYAATFGLFIPLIMLIIIFIKKKIFRRG